MGEFNRNYMDGIKYLLANGVGNIDSALQQMKSGLREDKLKLYTKSGLNTASILFNEKPKTGMKYLMATGSRNPRYIAKKMELMKHTTFKINLEKLGEYFGGEGKLNQNVMQAFVDDMALQGKSILSALRTLCAAFKLPGEAQKIDRIAEALGASYVRQNPGIYKDDPGQAFLMIFSMIMLNTDQHHASIKRSARMKEKQFIQNTQLAVPTASKKTLSGIYK